MCSAELSMNKIITSGPDFPLHNYTDWQGISNMIFLFELVLTDGCLSIAKTWESLLTECDIKPLFNVYYLSIQVIF